MRFFILALALFVVAIPHARAQDAAAARAEADRAEGELRSSLGAQPGITIQRTAPDTISVNMSSDITFDFDRSDVRYEFRDKVRSLAQTLVNHPMLIVNIVGHTDAIGSDQYNQRLSERRAASVGELLTYDGVPFSRISESGRGEWDPIASNETDWGRAQNRRVEITIQAKVK